MSPCPMHDLRVGINEFSCDRVPKVQVRHPDTGIQESDVPRAISVFVEMSLVLRMLR